ncbi:MAG: hypothetical protein R3F40_00550 [Candidatus Competibacteraceae bacterium]
MAPTSTSSAIGVTGNPYLASLERYRLRPIDRHQPAMVKLEMSEVFSLMFGLVIAFSPCANLAAREIDGQATKVIVGWNFPPRQASRFSLFRKKQVLSCTHRHR